MPDPEKINQIIKQYLRYQGSRKRVELAFFGGNFLGLSKSNVVELLECVQPWIIKGKIDGLRFSTRPDTISADSLKIIRPYEICAVELGVQSMNDRVLEKACRGHTAQDTIDAVRLLKKEDLKIGVQVMAGLPGDTDYDLLESTKRLANLNPDFARIYPLMVLKGSLVGQWFKNREYQPLTIEQSIDLVKQMYKIFQEHGVNVIRMGLQASDVMEDESMVVAGPWHPAFGHLVFSSIIFDLAILGIDDFLKRHATGQINIKVHPETESRLRGDKNKNIGLLEERYPDINISIVPDKRVQLNCVKIE